MINTNSALYYKLTEKKYVYNIMPIENVPSVLENGILCFDRMQQIHHSSIALNEVQELRAKVIVPNGLSLHQYANLYFSYNNAMLYKRKDIADTLCVLVLSATVLDIEGCIISDRNAATSLVRFYSPAEGLESLDFAKIHSQYWTNDNPYIQREHKAIKCAEILIPDHVPASYIMGAYVLNDASKELMVSKGFSKTVHARASIFYR